MAGGGEIGGRGEEKAQQPAGGLSMSRDPPPPPRDGDFSFPSDLFRGRRCIDAQRIERERERDGRIIFLHRGSARGRAINLSVAKAEDRAEVNRADQRSVKITLPRVALAIV